jgi:hypothetical protein
LTIPFVNFCLQRGVAAAASTLDDNAGSADHRRHWETTAVGERAMTTTTDDPELQRLADELAALTGETPAQAIRVAVAERLDRCRQDPFEHRRATLKAIRQTVSSLPQLAAFDEDPALR